VSTFEKGDLVFIKRGFREELHKYALHTWSVIETHQLSKAKLPVTYYSLSKKATAIAIHYGQRAQMVKSPKYGNLEIVTIKESVKGHPAQIIRIQASLLEPVLDVDTYQMLYDLNDDQDALTKISVLQANGYLRVTNAD